MERWSYESQLLLNEAENSPHGTVLLTGAKNLENGTPLFRAKDQSWRDEEATVANCGCDKIDYND